MIAISPSPALLLLLALLALLALPTQASVPRIDLADPSANKTLTLQGAGESDLFGVSSAAGDVNNDGFGDVIVGAYRASPNGRSNAGAAYVFYGNTSGFPTLDTLSFTPGNSTGFIIQGAAAGDSLGYSISGAGDVNGDRFADVIVGAYWADPYSRNGAGAAYVIFGGCGLTTLDMLYFTSSKSTGFIILGAAANLYLGWSVSGAGDVDGDGFDDVVVGAYGATHNIRDCAGAAYVIWGMASGFTDVDTLSFTSKNSAGFLIQGAEEGDELGYSVSGAGDVNGDGFDDLIVSARQAAPSFRTQAGVAYVILGKACGFTTMDMLYFTSGDSTGFIMFGAAAYDDLGNSVSGAGDVNGDGFDDVIVGASGADFYAEHNVADNYAPNPNERAISGTTYVIFGMARGFKTLGMLSFTSSDSTGFVIHGAERNNNLGYAVSGAGDVNNDGFADVIVAARSAVPKSRVNAGAAYVILGMGRGFTTLDMLNFTSSAFRGYIILGAAAGDQLGSSVSGAGDVNGDGLADVIVGAPFANPNGRPASGAAYVLISEL